MNEQLSCPIIDGHNDSLRALAEPFGLTAFLRGRSDGHVDLPRAREGGLRAGFFALYLPADPDAPPDGEIEFTENGYAVPLANPIDPMFAWRSVTDSLGALIRLEAESQGAVRIVRTIGDLESVLATDGLGVIAHLEGAEAIAADLENLELFYGAGLRSLGIVWSRPNAFGTGVPFRFPHSPDTGPGLTDAGRALIKECNRLGIMLDAAHLNERGFWDLVRETRAPVISTHTAAHALCAGSRNLTDRQLDAVRDTDGMVGVNFEVGAIRRDGGNLPDTPIATLLDHIDYLVGRVGIDRVGFGSDFDGATMSHELSDASRLPRLVSALVERGYGTAELRKLCHENWVRVLRAAWSERAS